MTDKTKAAAIAAEALHKATTGQALTNYPAIIRGFMEKGILPDEIKPRVNVFTFHAWKALRRTVRKGEHGVRVLTYIEGSRKVADAATGEEKVEGFKRPWTTTVFHITQTEERVA